MAAANSGIDITPLLTAPELRKFILSGVEQTGKSLGTGQYGDVDELFVHGTRVAGKRLNMAQLSLTGGNAQKMLQKFVSECELLNELCHPNIVRFLGLCFLPSPRVHSDSMQQPVMVMECIDDDLYHLLDSQANIHLSTKVSILLDVSRGLMYLHNHNPPVVHRDLTSSNILLTKSLQAKISDLGNAQCLIARSRVRSQTAMVPGSLIYMPPEASGPKPQCSAEVDIFSFGVIILHTVTQVFPGDLPAPKYTDETSKRYKEKIRTEVERRAPYLEIAYGQLGEDHTLSKLMCSCLHNTPRERPTARSIMNQLEGIKAMLKSKESDDMCVSGEIQNVQLRKGVRFDHEVDKNTELERAERKIKHQSINFMHTHVLHGHPSVLYKFKAGGFTMRRGTGEWQQYVFKIVDNHLQCLSLKEKLYKEISLTGVKDVKAHRSNNQMFTFHVRFDGKDSPWILSANSQEERICWMEAIKPGSTRDQWADPFQQTDNLIRKRANASSAEHPPLSRLHAQTVSISNDIDHPTPVDVANQSTKACRSMTVAMPPSADIQSTEKIKDTFPLEESTVEINVRQPTPPPRSEISLRSEPYDPYVSADEVLPPLEKRDSMWRNSKMMFDHSSMESDGHEDEASRDSIYLTILPPDEPSVSAPQSPTHHCHHNPAVDTKSTSEIVEELGKQFTPLEIDLLIKMLEKISAKTKATAKSKERRKSADDSVIKDKHEIDHVTKPPCADIEEDPGSDGLYSRLADLVLNLDDLEPADVLAEQNILCTPDSDAKSDATIVEIEHPLMESNTVSSSSSSSKSSIAAPVYSPRVPSRTNPQHGSLKEGNLSRKNAVRQRKGIPVHAKPKETVTHLRRLLRRASSEDYLEESDDTTAHPSWSRAVAKENDTFRFGLVAPSSSEREVFISYSDLHHLIQIEGGQYGPVYRASMNHNVTVDVIAKPIRKSLTKRVEFNSYIHELSALVKFKHPNVVHIYGIVHEAKLIVMKYFPVGNLKMFLSKNRSYSSDQLVKYMLDIAMGMHHITETLQLVHKNLAAHNVFVTEQGTCQVADVDIGLTTADHCDATRIRWMAPESLLNGIYSAASDVWSYGITIWEILNPMSVPYGDSDSQHCLEQITKGYTLAISPACPTKIGKIMRASWSQNPTKRPSFFYISNLLSSVPLTGTMKNLLNNSDFIRYH